MTPHPAIATPAANALSVSGLQIGYRTDFGVQVALRDIVLELRRAEILGVVGASGSGKSTLALALLGLLPPNAVHLDGRVVIDETEVAPAGDQAWRGIRGRKLAAVFQDPLTSLNPTMRVDAQLGDVLRAHRPRSSSRERRERILDALAEVGLPQPRRVARSYPHQLSGGMRQRVQIAMALLPEPLALIADEPTSALDVSLAGQVGDLLAGLSRSHAMAVLLISHDIGLVSRISDRVAVIDAGRVVEQGTTAQVTRAPQHATTRGMIDLAVMRYLREPVTRAGPADRPLVEARGVSVSFRAARRAGSGPRVDGDRVTAVREVDLDIRSGEFLALVGESGSGKSTLARALVGLQRIDGGAIRHMSHDEAQTRQPDRILRARFAQIVHQEAVASLSPRLAVGQLLEEPFTIHRIPRGRRRDPAALLAEVGLSPDLVRRYPHQLSGGQARRVCIARALALQPQLLVADEPTSGLDGPIAEEILSLLRAVWERTGVACLLITHDLDVARAVADRVGVMWAGRLVEVGPSEAVLSRPTHPETVRLLQGRIDPRPAT